MKDTMFYFMWRELLEDGNKVDLSMTMVLAKWLSTRWDPGFKRDNNMSSRSLSRHQYCLLCRLLVIRTEIHG